jgi:ABC-type dipeptide/oligopeptide/nickel transport system permease component
MGRYIVRRLLQSVFTVFGVMLITFVLFRIIAGDVSSSYVNQKLGM